MELVSSFKFRLNRLASPKSDYRATNNLHVFYLSLLLLFTNILLQKSIDRALNRANLLPGPTANFAICRFEFSVVSKLMFGQNRVLLMYVVFLLLKFFFLFAKILKIKIWA